MDHGPDLRRRSRRKVPLGCKARRIGKERLIADEIEYDLLGRPTL